MDIEVEKAIIAGFIRPSKRDRWLELIAKPDGRKKLRASLAHFRDLDPDVVMRIPSHQQDASSIQRLLIKEGAPGSCYLVSENGELDAKQMNLELALKLVVGYGFGTLLSCNPGLLGYFEGEGPGDRVILKKTRR
jgi:hypothetical protein